jgi:hypothetical protein
MTHDSQISYQQSKPLFENNFERIRKLRTEIGERQQKIGTVPLPDNRTSRLTRSSDLSCVVHWAEKVRVAIANLKTKTGRVLEPEQALSLVDDIVEGKLAADELAMIHGIPQEWVKTTLGHITRAVGSGRVRPLNAGGWYKFKSYEQPYDVAPGFAAAWKEARDLS